MLGLPPWEQVLRRLRHDYALATVALLAASGALVILPFALFRFASGQWLIGVIDLLVAAALMLPPWYALVTGRNRGAFLIMMVLVGSGSAAIAHFLGLAGHFWVFPFVVAAYALVTVRTALLVGWGLVLLVAVLGTGLESVPERLSFIATAGLVVTLAAISAHQVQRQHDALELAAATDALTGVGNRRRMDSDLRQAAALAARGGPLPALVVLDLDRFKAVNDSHGHDAGDRVLVNFAHILRDALRQSDRLYRMGGEEFVVLLPMVEPSGLLVVGEKLRRCVASRLAGPSGPVTASLGLALYQRGEAVEDWIGRADAALYQAKQGGRNAFIIAPWQATSAPSPAPARR